MGPDEAIKKYAFHLEEKARKDYVLKLYRKELYSMKYDPALIRDSQIFIETLGWRIAGTKAAGSFDVMVEPAAGKIYWDQKAYNQFSDSLYLPWENPFCQDCRWTATFIISVVLQLPDPEGNRETRDIAPIPMKIGIDPGEQFQPGHICWDSSVMSAAILAPRESVQACKRFGGGTPESLSNGAGMPFDKSKHRLNGTFCNGVTGMDR